MNYMTRSESGYEVASCSKNPLKMEELIKIKQNFCNIVGNMSRLC